MSRRRCVHGYCVCGVCGKDGRSRAATHACLAGRESQQRAGPGACRTPRTSGWEPQFALRRRRRSRRTRSLRVRATLQASRSVSRTTLSTSSSRRAPSPSSQRRATAGSTHLSGGPWSLAACTLHALRRRSLRPNRRATLLPAGRVAAGVASHCASLARSHRKRPLAPIAQPQRPLSVSAGTRAYGRVMVRVGRPKSHVSPCVPVRRCAFRRRRTGSRTSSST